MIKSAFKQKSVNDLKKDCDRLIELGLGDKTVLITSDDEGNEYHTLWYLFEEDIEVITDCKRAGLFHDENNPNDVVLLG